MNNQALQREAKRLVDYIVSLGSNFQIVTAQPETHIGVIIADAVLQVGHRWKTHVGPKLQGIKSKYPDAATIPGILTLLRTVGAQQLLNWKGTDPQKRFRQTVDFFHREGIDGFDDLRAWLASDDNRDRLVTKSSRNDRAGIEKIGDKTADYYRVMVGIPNAVAVDSYIRAFLRDADVRGGSQYHMARAIVQLAAPILSAVKNRPIQPVDLDQSIWEFQSQKREGNKAGHTMSGALIASEQRRKEGYAMNESRQVLKVTLRPDTMKQLERIAEDEFDIDASTLARVWIVERLKQLCVGYPLPTAEPQHTIGKPDPSSSGVVCLRGILDNGHLVDRPLFLRMNKTESQKLPWKQHESDISFIINNNPHSCTLRNLIWHPGPSEVAWIKQDHQFDKDLDAMDLHRLDRVELEADATKNTLRIIRKL